MRLAEFDKENEGQEKTDRWGNGETKAEQGSVQLGEVQEMLLEDIFGSGFL